MVKCSDAEFKDVFPKCDSEEKSKNDWDKPVKIENFPAPDHKYKIVYQSFNQSIEEVYFWLLTQIRDDFGMHEVKKITDIFTASENSAMWGQSQQRLSIQQDRISNYLAAIGKLVKDLFQLTLEVKRIKERLRHYDEVEKVIKEKPLMQRPKDFSADMVLKNTWIGLVEGGTKNPGSIYGMAATLGYAALPALFFSAPPMKADEIDAYVTKNLTDFTKPLQDYLKIKLRSYVVWRDETHKEIRNRDKFTIKFLRQHYNSIQIYIDWLKPYLRNVSRLTQNSLRSESEDLIGAFEGSVIEIETMFRRPIGKHYHPVIVMNIVYRSQPHMDYHAEGYQHRGPVHVGRTEIYLRGYTWTQKQYDKYQEMRNKERLELIGEIDASLKAAIDALGDDLRKYLKEAGEKFPEDEAAEKKKKEEEEKKKKQTKTAAEPFVALFSGFAEIFKAFSPIQSKPKSDEPSKWQQDKDRKAAAGVMEFVIWNAYKNFKKSHRMVTW